MNPAEELAHIKNLTRIRVKKHYDANREEINRKRREKYALKHAKPDIQEPTIEPEMVVEKLGKVVIPKTKKLKVKQQLDTDFIPLLKEQGKTKYINDLKRIVGIIGTNNLLDLNKKETFDKLTNSTKKNGETYAINSRKADFQCILYLIDNFNLAVKKEPYYDKFQEYKLESSDDRDVKAKEIIPTFKEYLGKVATTYGKDSKLFLIGSLYDAFTIRDDYQLKIVNKSDNEKDNFLVLPSMKIIINSYKTDKKYGKLVFQPKKPLVELIKKFMERTKVGLGDYLFENKPLTQFVSVNNKKMGFKGSINLFRHMKITDEHPNATPEKKVELTKIMGHSVLIQKTYLKSLKLI